MFVAKKFSVFVSLWWAPHAVVLYTNSRFSSDSYDCHHLGGVGADGFCDAAVLIRSLMYVIEIVNNKRWRKMSNPLKRKPKKLIHPVIIPNLSHNWPKKSSMKSLIIFWQNLANSDHSAVQSAHLCAIVARLCYYDDFSWRFSTNGSTYTSQTDTTSF